jgi:hypothetical protein
VNETARAEKTDRADTPRPTPRPQRGLPFAHPAPTEKRGWNPVVKIVVEAVGVFGLCLILYFIIRSL